jgi:uncharacterized phage protein (TIGR02218 family)
MGTGKIIQAGVEVVARESRDPQMRVAQVSAEVLAKSSLSPDLRVSKIQLEVLADPIPSVAGPCPCDAYDKARTDDLLKQTHFIARCWEFTRKDAVTYRFTEHDQELVVGGNLFTPVKGMSATAQQRVTGLDAGNYQAYGQVGTVSYNDMVSGLFQGARITELVVDWRHPFAGVFRCQTHYVQRLNFDGERWEAEMVGQRGRLEKTIGKVYTRNCRHKLGDLGCSVSLSGTPFKTSGLSVSAVDASEPARKFTAVSSLPAGFGFSDPINGSSWFRFGRVTWLTGNNAGFVSEVRAWDDTANTWELYLELPQNIVVNDTFDATAGCDHTLVHCETKFSNRPRFGGFPYMPGPDTLIRGPGVSLEQSIIGLLELLRFLI